MKNVIFTLFLLCSIFYAYGQQSGCDNNRYFNTIFENVTETKGVKYGQNTTIGGNTIDLQMDIYEPEGDVLEQRPLIVFAHGGGFISGERDNMDYICEDFAQKGFVTASISYRLFDADVSNPLVAAEAFIMTVHDMKAAVRYFREDAATTDLYGIDPDFIFAGGISAGAIMASSIGYTDDSDDIAPYIVDIFNANGGLEGNSSTNTQYSSEVQGVLNFSGGIPESHYIDANDPPLYSFHDEFDAILPCGFNPVIAPFHGSCDMHDAADAAGIKNKFYLHTESDDHVDWSYGTVLFESSQFLGEILCENAPNSSWEEVRSGIDKPGFRTWDISVVDENLLWVIPFDYTASQQFSKTTDGGQSWTTGTITTNDPSLGVFGIQGFDENTAIAMMLSFPDQESGKMYKTTDGGISWTEQSTSFVNQYEAPQVFHFFNENEGFALGDLINPVSSALSSHVGYITSDGGDTWEKLGNDVYPAAPGERILLNDTKYMHATGDHIRFGTRDGKMYHSADRGHNWEIHEVASGIAIQSVAFKDELNGIAVSGNESSGNDIIKAFSTSDGGLTWTELTVPPFPRTTGIYFVEGSDNGMNSCGTYIMFNGHYSISGSSFSNDGGQTWELISQQPVFDIEFLNPETGWMGGMIHGADKGGVYKWVGESLEGGDGCTTPTKEILIENTDLNIYPNPASAIVNIHLENDWTGAFTLQIMNTLGQMVYAEKFEKQNRSTTLELDLEKLNTGAYQVILSDGQRMMTKGIIKF